MVLPVLLVQDLHEMVPQHFIIDGRRMQRDPPLPDEILVINCYWGKEDIFLVCVATAKLPRLMQIMPPTHAHASNFS